MLSAGSARMKLQNMLRLRPSVAEVAANPRARSAVMRVAERTGEPWREEIVQ
jgi:16S rRNA (cytosine1402-N4)-methyltransferase